MKSKCIHNWLYEHTLWQAKDNDPNSIAVGRVCGDCGKIECCTAIKWKPIPKSYVDMKATLSRLYRPKPQQPAP